MKKYAIVRDQNTKKCDVGIGGDGEYYKSLGMEIMDVEKGADGQWYLKGFTPEPTAEEKAATIRAQRDRRIAVTDYLLAADYPISAEKLELVKAYRQSLRDIPQQDGFPWSGEIDDPAIPWPVLDEAATQAAR